MCETSISDLKFTKVDYTIRQNIRVIISFINILLTFAIGLRATVPWKWWVRINLNKIGANSKLSKLFSNITSVRRNIILRCFVFVNNEGFNNPIITVQYDIRTAILREFIRTYKFCVSILYTMILAKRVPI